MERTCEQGRGYDAERSVFDAAAKSGTNHFAKRTFNITQLLWPSLHAKKNQRAAQKRSCQSIQDLLWVSTVKGGASCYTERHKEMVPETYCCRVVWFVLQQQRVIHRNQHLIVLVQMWPSCSFVCTLSLEVIYFALLTQSTLPRHCQ